MLMQLCLVLLLLLLPTTPETTQPLTRDIDWRFHNASGRVFPTTGDTTNPIGTWRVVPQPGSRTRSVQLVEVIGPVGEHLLLAMRRPAPSRVAEPYYVRVDAFADSIWDALSDGFVDDLDGTGDFRLRVKLYLREVR